MTITTEYVKEIMEARDYSREEVLNELFTNYSFPGCYTIIFQLEDGTILCADCARKEFEDNPDISIHCSTYDEGPLMNCDDCNAEIESSYGEVE